MPDADIGPYKMQYTTIHEAIKKSDVFELELMVKNGASVNEVEEVHQFTPLHTACNTGALECVHWLLWHAADTTVVTDKGWSPAHIAAIRGQDACIQALANNNANLNASDCRGNTPAHLAATHGNCFTLGSILRYGVDVGSTNSNGWTATHAACYHGRLPCLQLLVRWGAQLEDVDNAGNTPAHMAAQEGHLPCLKYVVTAGSSPGRILSARNDHGETPRDLAQQFYKQNILDYIDNIEEEGDDTKDESNMAFPAHLAAYNGDLEHLRMLIEAGVVNINERDNKRSTPAHKAAGNGHLHVLRWLLEMGADMSLTNQAGETACDVARRFAQLGCIRILGGDHDDNRALHEDVTNEDVDTDGSPKTDLTTEQRKHAKGRARKRIEELDRLMEIAKKNFAQLGGKLPEEVKRTNDLKEREQTIHELEAQLDYERIKREKLEAQLDQYRRELVHLKSERPGSATYSDASDEKDTKKIKKKPLRKPRSYGDDGVFIKRNFTVPLKSGKKL